MNRTKHSLVHLRIFYSVFWMHFILFFLQQINLSDFVTSIFKGSIFLVYIAYFIVIIYSFRRTKPIRKTILILSVFLVLIIKLLFIQSFNVPLLYLALVGYCVYESDVSVDDLICLINRLAVIYFVIAVLFSYTSLSQFYNVEYREIDNKFLFSMNRFIGIEGSPAGPDIFYTLVLLFNIYKSKKTKFIITIPFVISVIVILWTSSLSNLIALIMAVLLYWLYRLRYLMVVIISNVSIFVAYLFHIGDVHQRVVLNTITSLRSHIWHQIWEGLLRFNTLEEWLFGRTKLLDFYSVGQRTVVDANPHNVYLFLLQFTGIPLFLFVILLLAKKVLDMNKNFFFLIVMFILVYSITNGMPLTTRGNPIIIYIFILSLFKFNKQNYYE